MNSIHVNIRNAFSQSVNSFLATQATIGNQNEIKSIKIVIVVAIFNLVKNKYTIRITLSSSQVGLRVSSLVPVNTLQIFNLLLAAPQHTAYI